MYLTIPYGYRIDHLISDNNGERAIAYQHSYETVIVSLNDRSEGAAHLFSIGNRDSNGNFADKSAKDYANGTRNIPRQMMGDYYTSDGKLYYMDVHPEALATWDQKGQSVNAVRGTSAMVRKYSYVIPPRHTNRPEHLLALPERSQARVSLDGYSDAAMASARPVSYRDEALSTILAQCEHLGVIHGHVVRETAEPKLLRSIYGDTLLSFSDPDEYESMTLIRDKALMDKHDLPDEIQKAVYYPGEPSLDARARPAS